MKQSGAADFALTARRNSECYLDARLLQCVRLRPYLSTRGSAVKKFTGMVSAVVFAGAALGSTLAFADIYRFNWAYRWASGQILHDASVQDSDPSSDREVYANSILGFEMSGLSESEFNFPQLRGSGGTLIIDRGATGNGNIDTITFMLGTATAGSPPTYQLVASFDGDYWAGPYTIDEPWAAALAGSVLRDGEPYFVAMTAGYGTMHELVVATVPEPGSWSLIGLAFAGLVLVGRKRLSALGDLDP